MRIVGHKSPRDLSRNHAPNFAKLQDFCGSMSVLAASFGESGDGAKHTCR
jgi:hypothetical protein